MNRSRSTKRPTTSRRAVIASGAAGGATLLAACGGSPSAPAGPGQAAGGKRGEVVLMDWADMSRPDYKGYFDWVGQEYARRFPGGSFKLEIIPFADYPTKFTVMAAAGTVPDAMATSNAWMRDFWALGGLLALDDRLKKQPEVQFSKFAPAAAFYGIRQGKAAGIPWQGPDSEVTLLNTQHFREAGLDPSYDKLKSWTWDDFVTAAEKLTVRQGNDVTRAGYQVKVPDGRHLAVWMYSQGGRLYNKDYTGLEVNNEMGTRVFEHLLLLLDGKRTSKGLGGSLTNMFLAGEATMVQAGNWQVSEIRLKGPQIQFDMIAYPRHPRSGKYATATWVNMVTIPKLSPRPDQAFEFVTWYCSLEGAIKRLEALEQYSPRLDFFETPQWKARVKDTPPLQRTQDIAAVGGERPGLRFDQMEAAMRPVFNQVMKSEISPRAAVAQLEQVTKPLFDTLPPAAR